MKNKMDAKIPELFRIHKKPHESWCEIGDFAVLKKKRTWYQLSLLSFVTGIYLGVGGIFASSAVAGLSNETRTNSPFTVSLVLSFTGPIGLVFVMIAGGELFTANILVEAVGCLQRKIKIKDALYVLGVTLVSNYAGCVFWALFALGTGAFRQDPYLSVVIAPLQHRIATEMWYQALLNGIGCNFLISLAIFISTSAQDVVGKLIAAFFPVVCVVVSGYEHAIAIVFNYHLAMFLGGNISYVQFFFVQFLPGILGNIIGGGVMVALVYTIVIPPPEEVQKKRRELREMKKRKKEKEMEKRSRSRSDTESKKK